MNTYPIKLLVVFTALYFLYRGWIKVWLNSMSKKDIARLSLKMYTKFETFIFGSFGVLSILWYISIAVVAVYIVFQTL